MEEQCEEEVFPTALCIMDRFLSLVQIQKSQLQLLATTCLLLSSKLVQNKTITTDRLVMFTDYSVTAEEVRVSEKTSHLAMFTVWIYKETSPYL